MKWRASDFVIFKIIEIFQKFSNLGAKNWVWSGLFYESDYDTVPLAVMEKFIQKFIQKWESQSS